MRTYEDIFNELNEPTDQRFTLYKVIDIFRKENDWVGSGFQFMKLAETVTEITGIRPGTCSGCKLNVLRDMARWVENYEKTLVETEPKQKRKRIGEN